MSIEPLKNPQNFVNELNNQVRESDVLNNDIIKDVDKLIQNCQHSISVNPEKLCGSMLNLSYTISKKFEKEKGNQLHDKIIGACTKVFSESSAPINPDRVKDQEDKYEKLVDHLCDYLGPRHLKKLATLFNMPKLARQFNDPYDDNGKKINFRNLNTQLIQKGLVTAFGVNVLEDGLKKIIGGLNFVKSVTKYKQNIPEGLRQDLKSYNNPYAEFKLEVNDHLGSNFLGRARMRLQVPKGIETKDFLDFAEYLEKEYGMDIHDQTTLTWLLEEIGMKNSKSTVEKLVKSMFLKMGYLPE